MCLIVAHPNAMGSLRGMAASWAYIDVSAADYERTAAVLAPNLPVMSPREVQASFEVDSESVVAWTDAAMAVCSDEELRASPVTRNPFDSFLIQLFWLRQIRRILYAGHVGNLVVVTRSAGARDTLLNMARQAGVPFRTLGRASFAMDRMLARTRATAKLCYQFATALVRHLAATTLLGRPYLERLAKAEVLVDSYLFAGDVTATGEVKHRYFPGLTRWYLERGMCAAYLPALFRIDWLNLPALYLGYRRSETLFVPVELVTTMGDAIHSAIESLVAANRTLPPLPTCDGLDLSPLVRDHQYRAALDHFEARLLGKAPTRAAALNIRPRLVIDWFENQSYDLALYGGSRKAWPGVRIVAMRQYAFMHDDLRLCVTRQEVERDLVPRLHYVCGTGWLAEAGRFDDLGRYGVAPALRYGWLHGVELSGSEGRDLLVLLTHSLEESLWQLSCLANALAECQAFFSRILVKPHPALAKGRLLARLHDGIAAKLAESHKVCWTQSALPELAHAVRVVVAAGTSAAVEAACLGLPVVLIGPRTGIELKPLHGVDGRLWTTVYNGPELATTLAAWSPNHPVALTERRQLAVNLRNSLFQTATAANMEIFAFEQVL